MEKMVENKQIVLLILTKDRPESINYYLSEKLDEYKNLGMDVVIYDSSVGRETEVVVQNYLSVGNLYYVSFSDNANDIYGTYKSIRAIEDVSSRYDYIWLCGDQVVVNYKECFDDINDCISKKVDLIHIYGKRHGGKSCDIENEKVFFANHFWSATHWCSCILHQDLAKSMIPIMDEYFRQNYVTVYVYAMFEALAINNYRIHYLNIDALSVSPFRTLSTSHIKKDIMNGWIRGNYVAFQNLNAEYEEYKNAAIAGVKKNVPLLTVVGAVKLRASGNLNASLFREYNADIKYWASSPMWWINCCAVMPVCMATLIVRTITGLSRMKKYLKGKLVCTRN